MPINRIDIISIPVSDQQKAKDFYTNVLGFEVLRDNPMNKEQRWIELTPPHGETSITLVTWFDQMPAGCMQGMVLKTSDLEEACDELRKKGLVLPEIQEAPWGRYVTFSDSDGNGWVLQED